MPTELQIIRAQEFIRMGACGHFDMEASKSALAELIGACRKRGIDQALMDLRALQPGPKPVFSTKDLTALVNLFPRVGFTQHQKLAVLYGSDPHRRARLFSLVANLHNWNVQAFDSYEAALSWLSATDSKPIEAEVEVTSRAKRVPVHKLPPVNTLAKPAAPQGIQIKYKAGAKGETLAPRSGPSQARSRAAIRPVLVWALMTALAGLPGAAFAQTPSVPTPAEVARALGFSDPEIEQIKAGEIISKDLPEGSAKELAGVVAGFLAQPLEGLAEKVLDGKFLESESTIQFHVWQPEAPASEQFAGISLGDSEANEAGNFLHADKGSRLNLSAQEIAHFRKLNDAGAVTAQVRAMLQARYEAYRSSGLKGTARYARGGGKSVSPGDELARAIQESMPGEHLPGYRQALLDYPQDPFPEAEHRFYWFKEQVEDRPTFILAHRMSARAKNTAVLTEEQYYVGHSYNCNFVLGAGFAVQGGTLVFYVNRTFTDQVAGFASGLRHSIGRKQMLSQVAANLKRIRDQASK